MLSNLPNASIETVVAWYHSDLLKTKRELASITVSTKSVQPQLQEAEPQKLNLQALADESRLHSQGQAVLSAAEDTEGLFSELNKAQQCCDSFHQAHNHLAKLQDDIKKHVLQPSTEV